MSGVDTTPASIVYSPMAYTDARMILTMFSVFVLLLGAVTALELAYLTSRLWHRLNRAHIEKRLRKVRP